MIIIGSYFLYELHVSRNHICLQINFAVSANPMFCPLLLQFMSILNYILSAKGVYFKDMQKIGRNVGLYLKPSYTG